MKLYDVPNKTWVKLTTVSIAPPGAREVELHEEVFFDHLDGMYSFCKDIHGNIVHLPGWQDVDIVNNT